MTDLFLCLEYQSIKILSHFYSNILNQFLCFYTNILHYHESNNFYFWYINSANYLSCIFTTILSVRFIKDFVILNRMFSHYIYKKVDSCFRILIFIVRLRINHFIYLALNKRLYFR